MGIADLRLQGVCMADDCSCWALNSLPCCVPATLSKGCSPPEAEHGQDAKPQETQDSPLTWMRLTSNYATVYILPTPPFLPPSLPPPQRSDPPRSQTALPASFSPARFLPRAFPQRISCISSALSASASQRTQSNRASMCQALRCMGAV